MTTDIFTLFEEFRTNPTELDRAFDKSRFPFDKQRVSDDGLYVRNDLAMERAVFQFRKLHGWEKVRVEYKHPEQPNLRYSIEGTLSPAYARTSEFIGTNGMRSHDALLVNDGTSARVVEIRYVVNVELL